MAAYLNDAVRRNDDNYFLYGLNSDSMGVEGLNFNPVNYGRRLRDGSAPRLELHSIRGFIRMARRRAVRGCLMPCVGRTSKLWLAKPCI